jgi:hypothetical protein
MDMIKEYVIKKALDVSFDIARKLLKESGTKLLTSEDDFEESISYHLRSVKNWSGEVSFNDLKTPKATTDIFIDLDLFVYPRRVRIHPAELVESIPLKNIFEYSNRHLVLLGLPGAGKTTSMKFLCQALFYNEEFYTDRFSFPILIKLRDLNNVKTTTDSAILVDQIYNLLGLKLDLPQELLKPDATAERKWLREKLVINVLDSLNVLLILDGFDEIVDIRRRDEVIQDVRNLATHLNNSTMVITSRTGDFVYRINNAVQFEFCPLSREQIRRFAIKWLNNEPRASDFIAKIYDSPFADTAIRPLTLAHLCAIYERIGKIPDKPKTIYKKIVNLLLEDWDQQRSVKRQSRYAHFEVDRKFDFLCHLAYILTTTLQKTVFTERDLLKVYKEIFRNYDLVGHEAQQVVCELETHTGLFLQSGFDQFEFAHKSLQEYLSSEYLVKLPSIPRNRKTLSELPNELAIAVTISSSPSDYFCELVLNRLRGQALSEDFVKAFLSRLLLEKPDFNSNTRLGLSLIILYSIYVEYNVVSESQLKLFYTDNVTSEFEKLIRLMISGSSLDIIRSLYKTEYVYRLEDGASLCLMVKSKKLRSRKLQIEDSDLPLRIYIRESLLEEATENQQKPTVQ